MQGAEPVERTYRRRCSRCGTRFKIASKIGPSLICDECARKLTEIIFACRIPGKDKFGCWILERK